MPAYHFTAVTGGGALRKGTMEAKDQRSVLRQLQREGYIPIRAEAITWQNSLLTGFNLDRLTGKRLTRDDLATVTREMAMMLGAGEDLNHALQFVCETAPNHRIRAVMTEIREVVRGGSPFSTAISGPQARFPDLYIGLVRAGEASGTLAESLERLAELLERQRSLSTAITSALIYPALLTLAAIGTITLLVGYVLPQFVPLFEQNGMKMPPATQLMVDLGHGLFSAGPWLLLLALVGTFVGNRLLAAPDFRRPVDRLLLRLPIIGSLLREILAARFSRTLGTLLSNGTPLVPALGIVKGTLGNLEAIAAMETAIVGVRGGGRLAQSLEVAKILPRRTTHLLRVGEETAQLGAIALKAAAIHEEETRVRMQRFVSLLVPAITIGLGGAVASIIGSMLTAMLSLNDLAQ